MSPVRGDTKELTFKSTEGASDQAHELLVLVLTEETFLSQNVSRPIRDNLSAERRYQSRLDHGYYISLRVII